MEFDSVLVPTDFSGASDLALRWANLLASKYKAKLTLLHVVEALPVHDYALTEPTAGFANLYQERMMTRARSELREAASSVAEPGVQADTTILSGDPAKEILAAATSAHADLVVMATHGRAGLSHAILGSVVEKFLRSAPCPVLAVKRKAEQSPPDAELKKILFATDLSDESLEALKVACSLAERFGAKIDALYVLSDPAQYPLMSWEIFPAVQSTDFYRQSEAEGRHALQEKLAGRLQGSIRGNLEVLHGSAAEVIVEASRDGDHDLIVLSTHGRSGLKRALLGSVAERVLRRAECPVLLVRAPEGR